MKKEIVITAKTIEAAVEQGAKELGESKDNVTYEVLELPKKGFLGLGSTDAKVRVMAEKGAAQTALDFLAKIIGHMGINAKPKVVGEDEGEIKIDIIGENLGILIGYHGEILDSLQYLTFLAVNKGEEGDEEKKAGVVRILIDVENYRKKREETLRSLAKKMAERVLKYSRSVTLEPMSAYERRIIHSTIQEIDGVTTYSIGQDNDRKIVISKEGMQNLNTSSGRRYGDTTRTGGFVPRTAPRPAQPSATGVKKDNQ